MERGTSRYCRHFILGFFAFPKLSFLDPELHLVLYPEFLGAGFPELGWTGRKGSSDLATSRTRGEPCWGLEIASRIL
jgi:hypothetical protein